MQQNQVVSSKSVRQCDQNLCIVNCFWFSDKLDRIVLVKLINTLNVNDTFFSLDDLESSSCA